MPTKRELFIRKINKLEREIIKISERGKDNYIYFLRYVNSLIDKGDYNIFKEVLNTKFNIIIPNEMPSRDATKYAWKELLKNERGFLLNRLSDLYKSEGVHQQSFSIHNNSDGNKLGEIFEIDVVTTNDPNYLVEDISLLEKKGLRRKFLEVLKNGETNSILINYVNTSLTEERNLIERYKQAIKYLKEN